MNTRRRMTGFVTSNKMMKTVVVEITRTYQHPLYKKVVHSSKRVKAHDEIGCQVGDEVQIVETRPISAEKNWVVEKIVRHVSGGEDVVGVEGTVETEESAVKTEGSADETEGSADETEGSVIEAEEKEE